MNPAVLATFVFALAFASARADEAELRLSPELAIATEQSIQTLPAGVQDEWLDLAADSEETASEAEVRIPEAALPSRDYRIVGRGVRDRKSGDVIALACIGQRDPATQEDSCRELQHLLLSAKTREVRPIGPRIRFKSGAEPDRSQLKKVVRKINREIRDYKKERNSKTRGKILGWFATASALGFGVCVIVKNEMLLAAGGAGLATGPVLLSWLGLMVVVFGTQELIRHPLFAKNGLISRVMTDQGGWNWSVRPRTVSGKTYSWMLRFLDGHDVSWYNDAVEF